MEIIPAILTSDPLELDSLLRQIRDSKKYARVQIDFVDGEYAANKTFKPMEADLIPYLPLKFDAHLMVTENNIVEWSLMAEKFGFERVIAQVEAISHPEEFTALALDIHSPVRTIEPYLKKLKLVVVMAIEPGFGGQEFIDKAIEHVKLLDEWRKVKKYKYEICVDGGVEQEHLPVLISAGANCVAVGAKRVLQWM